MAGVDELLVRGRDVGQDAEPGVGVGALEGAAEPLGYRAAGDAPEAVAAGHVVALQDRIAALVPVADSGAGGGGVLHGEGLGLEEQRVTLLQLEGDEVLADLGLGVDHHRAAAGESGEVDAVAGAVEAQFDAVVAQPLAVHALTRAGRAQDVHGALLQDPGALAVLDIGAVTALQDDRVDAGGVQEPGQEEARGAGSDDADGGAHRSFPSHTKGGGRACVRRVKFVSPG